MTVLPDEARAACATAFAEVFAKAEAEEVRDLEVALRDAAEQRAAVTPRRVAGFYEAVRMSEPMATTPDPTYYEKEVASATSFLLHYEK